MSASALLAELGARGVRVHAVDGRLRVEGPPEVVTDDLADQVRQMKSDLMRILAPSPRQWDAADWREYFDERVAVAMIDGQQPEAEARRIAWQCCVTRWRDLHPVTSKPLQCAHCGRPDEPGNIIPFGTGPHAWLHSGCWPAWDQAQREAAELALRELVGAANHD